MAIYSTWYNIKNCIVRTTRYYMWHLVYLGPDMQSTKHNMRIWSHFMYRTYLIIFATLRDWTCPASSQTRSRGLRSNARAKHNSCRHSTAGLLRNFIISYSSHPHHYTPINFTHWWVYICRWLHVELETAGAFKKDCENTACLPAQQTSFGWFCFIC